MPRLNACAFRAASSGSGNFVVNSAITGYYKPEECTNPSVIDGAKYRYRAELDDRSEYEEGEGVYTASSDTLARTTIFSSSDSGAKVTFSSAPKVIVSGLHQDFGWELVKTGSFSSVAEADIDLPTATAVDYASLHVRYFDIVPDGTAGFVGFAIWDTGNAQLAQVFPSLPLSGAEPINLSSIFCVGDGASGNRQVSYESGIAICAGAASTVTNIGSFDANNPFSNGLTFKLLLQDGAEQPLDIASGSYTVWGLVA